MSPIVLSLSLKGGTKYKMLVRERLGDAENVGRSQEVQVVSRNWKGGGARTDSPPKIQKERIPDDIFILAQQL